MGHNELDRIKKIFSSKEIAIKSNCYLLYHNGLFGNKAKTWKSYNDLLKSKWKGLVSIRSNKGMARAKVRYNIPPERVLYELKTMLKEGISEEDITFNESMPDEKLLIQGEIMLTEEGLYVLYSDIKKPMNLALKEKVLHAKKLQAKLLLENNLSPSSLADLYALLDLFPNSVIEFSSYNIQVGNLKGRNTIIWEVRNY